MRVPDEHLIRLLVVDDEPAARLAIRQLAGTVPDLVVAGECADAESAARRLAEGGIDLLLLDVRLPGMSGLELVDRLGPQRLPPVVYVTAHDAAAVTAFELDALDFLPKPVARRRFSEAIARFRRRRDEARSDSRVDDRRLALRSGRRIVLVPVDAIDWLSAAGDYTELHHCGSTHVLYQGFAATLAELGARHFLLLRRGLAVARRCIREIRLEDNGTGRVLLEDGSVLALSRRCRAQLEVLLAVRN